MVRLFDPHPGLMGCTVAIPEPVRLRASQMSGAELPVEVAANMISEVAPEGFSVETVAFDDEPGCGMICLQEPGGPVVNGFELPKNSWRVLKYEPAGN